jgi:glycosyltransferase involved in cell wall biosynthesis
MKILYASLDDPRDQRAWSGLVHYIWRSLVDAGANVEVACAYAPKVSSMWRLVEKVTSKMGKRYLSQLRPSYIRNLSIGLGKAFASTKCDIIFSPSSIPFAYLPSGPKCFFWVDACFASMLNFYFDESKLMSVSVKNGHDAENRACSRVASCIYSSDWAAELAQSNYPECVGKTHVIPYGPNLRQLLPEREIRDAILARRQETTRVLFIGVEWERKRAMDCVEAVRCLNESGVKAELDIVGCVPPKDVQLPSWVRVHGFIRKWESEGEKRLKELFLSAHWFILPSIAEAYGLVLVEALAHGVPCLCRAVGGMPTIVREGVSGHVLPRESSPVEYAQVIARYRNDAFGYRKLAESSLSLQRRELNWQVAGRRALALMEQSI